MLIPKVLAHTLTIGLYSRINAAFMQARSSLQWFIDNYTDLATLRSILQRLSEFERVVAHPFEKSILRQTGPHPIYGLKILFSGGPMALF